MSYRIGEVAQKMGLSTSTLRFYDKHGLLPFVQRDENGNRRFTDNDLNYLDVINALKRSGVPVETIATFIDLCMKGDSTLKQRYQYLQKTESALANQIHQLQLQMAFLKFKKWYYETAITANTESIHFLPNTKNFDPKTKQEYFLQHPEESDFEHFLN